MAHIVRHFFAFFPSRPTAPFSLHPPARSDTDRIALRRSPSLARRDHHRISCPPGQRFLQLRIINRFIPRN
jgi:hypothetical protein